MALNGRGACYYAKAEYDKALADFDAALKVDANYVSALVNRANAWRGKKDYARAKADYDKALTLKPGMPAAKKGSDDMVRLLAGKSSGGTPAADTAPAGEHDHN